MILYIYIYISVPARPLHSGATPCPYLTAPCSFYIAPCVFMPKLTKKLISNDVPSKISFTSKSALHLPTAPCTFQNLTGTLFTEYKNHAWRMGEILVSWWSWLINNHLHYDGHVTQILTPDWPDVFVYSKWKHMVLFIWWSSVPFLFICLITVFFPHFMLLLWHKYGLIILIIIIMAEMAVFNMAGNLNKRDAYGLLFIASPRRLILNKFRI